MIMAISALILTLSMTILAYASTPCPVSGCNDVTSSGRSYCYTHTCRENGCNKKAVNRYCSEHKCKQSGCDRRYWYTSGKYKGYCERCAVDNASPKAKQELYNANKKYIPEKKTTKTNNKKSNSAKNTSTSKKKSSTMPDCDDYDSYEDFMDDWDGNMPDGSDAEDYWENW